MTIKQIQKALFPDLKIDQVDALLWHCTSYPMVGGEEVLAQLESIAGVHAAGESFKSLMFLFGPDWDELFRSGPKPCGRALKKRDLIER